MGRHIHNDDSKPAANQDTIPSIAITPGEPAGIGPDIVLEIAKQNTGAELIIFSDPVLLAQRADMLGMDISLVEFDPGAEKTLVPGQLKYVYTEGYHHVEPGEPLPVNAEHVLNTIETAVKANLDGKFDALVTGPVNKAIIKEGGYEFSGHTEYIAGICHDSFPVMMLLNERVRVALVTTHLPLNEVSKAITPEKLHRVISIVHHDLESIFSITNSSLLVCGLNPHAGEQGHLGKEEIEIIIPVVEELRNQGIDINGPVPADTAFLPRMIKDYDVVICMYHDQGLPVLKSMGFGESVNITLGLPILRTSVDHGTAFELAGTGKADISSMQAAIDLTVSLIKTHHL